ncbi:hypothetical protein JCM10207_003447 [Rhodosporidiobolus poonsookiae]
MSESYAVVSDVVSYHALPRCAAALPMVLYTNPLPFAHFADLVRRFSEIKPRKKGTANRTGEPSKQRQLLQAWVDSVREQHGVELPEGTVVLFFRLFFPEEGVRRRYGLAEKTLAEALETLFKVKPGRFGCWSLANVNGTTPASGCLGEEVRRWMEKRCKGRGRETALTLGRLDELLDELATFSPWSANEVQQLKHRFTGRPVSHVLRDLFESLSPFETAVVVQLILRDLSPLLYPPPSSSSEVALARYNTTAYDQLTPIEAMRIWHPEMEKQYRVVADLDWVARQTEEAIRTGRCISRPFPRIGRPIKIPKTEKPGSCSRATRHLAGEVAVETKYDGERLQIHVDLSLPPQQQIRIFSKSGRDSTTTRERLLPIIRAGLDLPLSPLDATLHPLLFQRLLSSTSSNAPSPFPPTKLVLEGEMVPYDESRGCIDEFWRLGEAKQGREDGGFRPAGPCTWRSGGGYRGRRQEESGETGATDVTPSPRQPLDASPDGQAQAARGMNLHLMVVWFDLLVVDDESLLDEPYELRRARLESLVRPLEGFSMLADSVLINFDHPPSALENLRLRFAHIITKRCEGLMLKPLTSRYNDVRRGQRWVKLKKDFIPGAGDTLDFHVIGASWQKQRGRELGVGPSVYTTFFVGLRAEELGLSYKRANKPHYHVLFSVSYGLTRDQLAKLCDEIRASQPERFDLDYMGETSFRRVEARKTRTSMPVYESASTSFTFSLASDHRAASRRPTTIFREARVMELNGAGFQREGGSPYYELRFPRITKPSRTDGSPLSLQQLQATATDAMCAAPSEAAELVARLWQGIGKGKEGKRGETKEEKYAREVREWVGRLEAADGVLDDGMDARRGATRAPQADEVAIASKPSIETVLSPSSAPAQAPPPPCDKALMPPPASPPTLKRLPLVPTTPPRLASQPLSRSVSSPCARSDAPSPSQTILRLPLTRERLTLPATASAPDLSRPRLSSAALPPSKRQCLSSTSRRSSLASLNATLSTFLPSQDAPPSSSPSASLFSSASPVAWSIHPPLPPADPFPEPRHADLTPRTYFASALAVLWLAGYSPPSFSPAQTSAHRGPLRQGYIFVAAVAVESCVDWLRREAEAGRVEGRKTELVWVVKREALEARADFGEDVLFIL